MFRSRYGHDENTNILIYVLAMESMKRHTVIVYWWTMTYIWPLFFYFAASICFPPFFYRLGVYELGILSLWMLTFVLACSSHWIFFHFNFSLEILPNNTYCAVLFLWEGVLLCACFVNDVFQTVVGWSRYCCTLLSLASSFKPKKVLSRFSFRFSIGFVSSW